MCQLLVADFQANKWLAILEKKLEWHGLNSDRDACKFTLILQMKLCAWDSGNLKTQSIPLKRKCNSYGSLEIGTAPLHTVMGIHITSVTNKATAWPLHWPGHTTIFDVFKVYSFHEMKSKVCIIKMKL